MQLNVSQIQKITTGAVRVEQQEDGIHFYRFTKQQEELYQNRNADFYRKLFATSGVQLCFRTNSDALFLRAEVTPGSSRTYFAFEAFVNGKRVGTLDNFSQTEIPRKYANMERPLGEFSKTFSLGSGGKEVRLVFPWSVKAVLKELCLDDGAFIVPQKQRKTVLCFGDSITQGYDALYPSNKYITQLAKLLGANEYNKAIGGEVFFPPLAAAKEEFEPDYITVAYGTNDWHRSERETMTTNCAKFLANLTQNYPNVPILVITPIWRKDMHLEEAFGAFEDVAHIIEQQAAAFANVTVVHGFTFVPQDENLFADLRLHPNDTGFAHYAESVSAAVHSQWLPLQPD